MSYKQEMINLKIEMIGYNDTKAIAIYGTIKMTPFFIASFLMACLSLIPTFVFGIYELLYIFIVPGLLLFLILFQYIGNPCMKGFLEGQKIKHKFCLEDGILYKNGKEVKNISNIKLYKFKKFLFLELKKSYYRIMNNDYIFGSRDEFIAQLRFEHRHYITFNLPPKSDAKCNGDKQNIKNYEFDYLDGSVGHYFIWAKYRMGTFYHEFQFGNYPDIYWDDKSILLSDDVMEKSKIYELFERIIPNYDYYGNSLVTKEIWELIKIESRKESNVIQEIIDELSPWAERSISSHGCFTIKGI